MSAPYRKNSGVILGLRMGARPGPWKMRYNGSRVCDAAPTRCIAHRITNRGCIARGMTGRLGRPWHNKFLRRESRDRYSVGAEGGVNAHESDSNFEDGALDFARVEK
jgi:hypothetical protein